MLWYEILLFVGLAVGSVLLLIGGIWWYNKRTVKIYQYRCMLKSISKTEKNVLSSRMSSDMIKAVGKENCGIVDMEPSLYEFNEMQTEKLNNEIRQLDAEVDIKTKQAYESYKCEPPNIAKLTGQEADRAKDEFAICKDARNEKLLNITKEYDEKVNKAMSTYNLDYARSKDLWDLRTKQIFTLLIILQIVFLGAGIGLLIYSYWKPQLTNWASYILVFGAVPTFLTLLHRYSRKGLKENGDRIYTEAMILEKGQKEAELEASEASKQVKSRYTKDQFITNLYHAYGWIILMIGIIIIVIYAILTIAEPIYDFLIFPSVIICVGYLIQKYHDDGYEKPPILDAEDKAKTKIGYDVMIVGAIVLAIVVIVLIIYGFVIQGAMISSMFFIALIRKKKKTTSMDNCIDIGFDSDLCMPMKAKYCEENPDADICKI